jgi:hypothetical protein
VTFRGPLLFATGFAAALAAGWVGFPAALYEKSEQPLQFNHLAHKDTGGMACADCHGFREDASFAGIPKLENCAGCHAEPLGNTPAEKRLVEHYVTPNRELVWHVYSRQPMNVRFSHAIHVESAKLKCEECHGDHGTTKNVRLYYENRISGYSRDVWGSNLARINLKLGEGMKMTDCEDCHARHGVHAGCLGCHK